MGRSSALMPEQWHEVEPRHLVEGESLNSLAAAYGVNESSLRHRMKPKAEGKTNSPEQLKQLAASMVRTDSERDALLKQVGALPYAKQEIVRNLATKLRNTSEHLASVAELGAVSSHRLTLLANQQLQLVDDVDRPGTRRERHAPPLRQAVHRRRREVGARPGESAGVDGEAVRRAGDQDGVGHDGFLGQTMSASGRLRTYAFDTINSRNIGNNSR